jgi:shikimate kinase
MVKGHIVYIIGFMGSGKSTAGKKLASLLGWKFIDLDKSIEEYIGKSIPAIFSEEGEPFFRETEAKLLKNIESLSDTIISTGGGTPCYGDNMDFMLNTGLTVYLKLTPGQLKSRLAGSDGDRPLISNLKPEELLDFITKKLAEREKWYDRSELILKGIDLDISVLHAKIKSGLNL